MSRRIALVGLFFVVVTLWLTWVLGGLLVRHGLTWVEAGAVLLLYGVTVAAIAPGPDR